MLTISDNSRNVLVGLLCLIIKCHHRPNVTIKIKEQHFPFLFLFLTFKTNPKKQFSPGKSTYFKPKLNFSLVSLYPAFSKAGKQGFPELTIHDTQKDDKIPWESLFSPTCRQLKSPLGLFLWVWPVYLIFKLKLNNFKYHPHLTSCSHLGSREMWRQGRTGKRNELQKRNHLGKKRQMYRRKTSTATMENSVEIP